MAVSLPISGVADKAISGLINLANTPVIGWRRLRKKTDKSGKKVEESALSVEVRAWEIAGLGLVAALLYGIDTWGREQGKGLSFPDWISVASPGMAVISSVEADASGNPQGGLSWTAIASANPVLGILSVLAPPPSSIQPHPTDPNKVVATWTPPIQVKLPPWWGAIMPALSVTPQ